MTALERAELTMVLGDAFHQELKPLIEQHTRRMMVATIFAQLVPPIGHVKTVAEVEENIQQVIKVTARIMKETE